MVLTTQQKLPDFSKLGKMTFKDTWRKIMDSEPQEISSDSSSFIIEAKNKIDIH